MGLSIVQGPPNAGRAGVVRKRFTAALGRDPLLVVPTLDDVFNFERELAPAGGALLGGTVTTFAGLFREVAAATSGVPPPELTDEQRLLCVRSATVRARPRLLRASAERPGFAPALDELLGELQAARVGPGQVADGASGIEDSAFLSEIAAIYEAYLDIRTETGRSDRFSGAEVAIEELRRVPASWRARPVLLYGFDDMTGQQLALLAELAQTADVTVAVTYEDRPALLARSRLTSALLDVTPRDRETDETLPANPANTVSPLLYALARGFLEPDAGRMAPDGSLTILRNDGERRESEAVAAEVARLLAEGEEPESIAIVARDPSEGTLTDIIERYGIPVAVEADSPVTSTATGAALLGLLRAAEPTGSATDLLAFLRAPARGRGASVDDLERKVRRRRVGSAANAAATWAEMGGGGLEPYEGLRDATDGRAALALAADIARDLAQWPLKREGRQGTEFAGAEAKELRAGEEIATRLSDLLALRELEPRRQDIVALIEAMTVPLWSGPAAGRVRLARPYRLRAARFRTVFVLAREDGSFPRHGGGEPFLSEDQRRAVGLPERIQPELEERYLFGICLSLPTHRLYLSYRACNEDGAPLSPSPYLDEVRYLLEPGPPAPGEDDPLEDVLIRRRGLSEAVFEPAAAPSEDELARSLAVYRDEGAKHLDGLELEADVRSRVTARLESARAYNSAPADLRDPYVLARVAERRGYGGTTLEEYATCSYRWLVSHELKPRALDPDPEPLEQGSVAHDVFERLYEEAPAGGPRPTPETLAAWQNRASEILDEEMGEDGGAAGRVSRRRLGALIGSFLRRESERRDSFDEVHVEAGFGMEGDEDPGGLDFGDWELHGYIDRMDVDPRRREVVVHDYKLGRKVTAQGAFEKRRRLQMALYLRAAEKRWDLSPVAGLYQPLGGGDKAVPRGLGRRDSLDETTEPLGLHDRDWVDDETFEQRLARAEEMANEYVADIRAGRVTRDPIEDKCPWYCTFAPICRMDRRADPSAAEGGSGGGESDG